MQTLSPLTHAATPWKRSNVPPCSSQKVTSTGRGAGGEGGGVSFMGRGVGGEGGGEGSVLLGRLVCGEPTSGVE